MLHPLLLEINEVINKHDAEFVKCKKLKNFSAASMAHMQANIWRANLCLTADILGYDPAGVFVELKQGKVE